MEFDYIQQGDCFELIKRVPDKSIDMILCDLPYGSTRNNWDVTLPFDELWKEWKRVIKENGAIVLFSQFPFTAELILSNKSWFRYEWIWEKTKATGHLNAKKMPLKKHENILVFYKKLPVFHPQGLIKKPHPTIRKGTNNGTNYGKSDKDAIQEYENYPVDILRFQSVAKPIHPTQKPVDLLEYLIKTYTNEGDVILDSCMGSGSTCVAAVNTNRHYIGFELNNMYFDLACMRLDEVEGDNNVSAV